jgi:putative spermidine/putrescine transport system permease protein
MIFVAPFGVYLAAMFLLPIGAIVYTSFVPEGTNEFSLQFYQEFFTESLYLRVLWTTFEISFVAAALALMVGYPVAYYLAKQPPRRRLYLSMFVLLPFYTSILVKSFALTVFLGHSGAVNWFIRLLLGDEFGLNLMFNRTGVMFGLTHTTLPYVVFPILANLLNQDPTLHKAAEVMGAGRARIFWQVTFPLSMPGVLVAILLCVVHNMGSFVVPALLGGRKDIMMANLIYLNVETLLDWNQAAAVSLILVLMSGVFLIALARIRTGAMFGGDR